MNQLTGHLSLLFLKKSRDCSVKKKKISAHRKRPKMTNHRDNDNPNHKDNATEFLPSGKGQTSDT